MSSEEEDDPSPKQIAENLRRSKRISGSEKKISPSKVAKKNDERPKRKCSTKPNPTSGKKAKRGRPPKTEQSSNSFNGSYLTPDELQHLFIKFKRDGHFRVNPPNISPPPFVISRTSDGKSVTTKIECYDPFTVQKTGSEDAGKTSDGTSVTFSTPLTENPAENLGSTSANREQFISPKDKPTNAKPKQSVYSKDPNSGRNLPANYARKTQNSLPNPLYYYNAGNGYSENSPGPNVQSKSSGNSQGNGFGRTFGPTDFPHSNSARQTLPVRSNTIFKAPPLSTWIPPNQSAQETQNTSNTREIYLPGNAHYKNGLGGDQANRTFRRNFTENPRANVDVQILPNPYSYSNLNDARIRSPSYQQRQTNAQNSTFPSQNSTVPLHSSSFPLQNSTVPRQSSTFPVQNSTLPLQNSTFNEWNAVNASSMPNDGMVYMPINANSYASTQRMNTGYHSAYTSWTDEQWSPNSYISATVPPHFNCYNTSNAQGRCEIAKKSPIDDQTCISTQINSWSQNNQPGKDFCGTNSDIIRTDSNVSAVTTSDNKQSMKEAAFTVESSEDPQNNLLCPTESSSSYNDDISYDNYIGGDMSYNDANLTPSTQENGRSSRLPSFMSIKTEMRPWYHESSRYFENNAFNTFGTKSCDVDSSDCSIIEQLSKS